jgi:hypothetical protein
MSNRGTGATLYIAWAASATRTRTCPAACTLSCDVCDERDWLHMHEQAEREGELWTQRLTMSGEVWAALAERVVSTLDYHVRWQPNEYEPDGFVERVRPLELSNGILQDLTTE